MGRKEVKPETASLVDVESLTRRRPRGEVNRSKMQIYTPPPSRRLPGVARVGISGQKAEATVEEGEMTGKAIHSSPSEFGEEDEARSPTKTQRVQLKQDAAFSSSRTNSDRTVKPVQQRRPSKDSTRRAKKLSARRSLQKLEQGIHDSQQSTAEDDDTGGATERQPAGRVSRERWLAETFDGLPFGPDIPAVSADWKRCAT